MFTLNVKKENSSKNETSSSIKSSTNVASKESVSSPSSLSSPAVASTIPATQEAAQQTLSYVIVVEWWKRQSCFDLVLE